MSASDAIRHERYVTRSVIATATMLMALPIMLTLGPRVEARIFPVIEEKSSIAILKNDRIEYHGILEKYRNCPVEHATAVYTGPEGTQYPLLRAEPWNRALTGRVELKTTYRQPFKAPEGGVLRRRIWYKCHSLWLTPYAVPDLPVTSEVGP